MRYALQTFRFETRAAAFDERDQPVSIFIWPDRRLDPAVRSGDVCSVIVRSVDKGRAEAFVEFENGETGFFNLSPKRTPPHEGQRLTVLVRAEAWQEKSALVRPVDQSASSLSPETALNEWRATLGLSDQAEWTGRDADDRLDAAVTEAVAPSATLPGGGELHFDYARALTAVDVDTSGRKGRSSHNEINSEALNALARNVSLRRLGGLIVIDLCGKVRREYGEAMRTTFQSATREYGLPRCEVLLPSPLGLMEMAVPRTKRPILEYDSEACSSERTVAMALCRCLREMEFALRDDRTARYEVGVSAHIARYLDEISIDFVSDLASVYGHRLRISDVRLRDSDFDIRSDK